MNFSKQRKSLNIKMDWDSQTKNVYTIYDIILNLLLSLSIILYLILMLDRL